MWKILHVITLNIPLVPSAIESQQYFNLFQSLCTTLPCRFCRDHFCRIVNNKKSRNQLKKSMFFHRKNDRPGDVRIRVSLWLVDLHNAVNKRLGKNSTKREEWLTKYANLRAK